MKKEVLLMGMLFSVLNVHSQAFHKGTFNIQLTEGGAASHFITSGEIKNEGDHGGDRDPITVEYGFTDQFGVGLSLGTDLYKLKDGKFYPFQTQSGYVNLYYSETTLDLYYHFKNTNRMDISAFTAMGMAVITLKGSDYGENGYQYNAKGFTARIGTQLKYYFTRKFGITTMFSCYGTQCSPNGISGNNVANNIHTSMFGYAFEFGHCFKFK